jgi:hypothetical protein
VRALRVVRATRAAAFQFLLSGFGLDLGRLSGHRNGIHSNLFLLLLFLRCCHDEGESQQDDQQKQRKLMH